MIILVFCSFNRIYFKEKHVTLILKVFNLQRDSVSFNLIDDDDAG